MSAAARAGRVALELHGVGVSVDSDLAEFARYVARAMEPFLVTTGAAPRVHSRLEWVEGEPQSDPRRAFGLERWEHQPDRDLYLTGTSACWLRIDDFEDLQLAASWQGGRLELRGRYHFRLGRNPRVERLRKLLYRRRLDVLRARRFSTLLYYLVYHPILWLLSRERGWHVMHAGGVASAQGAVVLAGMPGCGKSTLAVAMTADRAWTMLSDNLLLHDGARVVACPELLLLDRGSIARAGAGAARLVPVGEKRVYDRDAYRPDVVELRPAAPLALFNVGRARATELVPLDAATAAAAVGRDNLLAKEVRRIAIMAEVLDLVAGAAAPDAGAAVARLTASVPCHQLWIAAGADLAEVIRAHVLPALADARRSPSRVSA